MTDHDETCQSCGSYLATTRREEAPVCRGCAHMIDAHGAHLYDAYVADTCQEGA